MSQDKSQEFSLEGLEDPVLEEGQENFEASTLDEGFELDLSEDLEDLDLGDNEPGDESQDLGNLNEFSLTSVKMSLPLAEDNEGIDEGQVSSNEIDLGDDSDKFDLGDEELAFEDSDADIDMEMELSEPDLDVGGDDLNLLDNLAESELFNDIETEDESLGILEEYSAPKLNLGAEDLTEDVKAKLKEIDAIMEDDTKAGINIGLSKLNEEEDDSEMFSVNESIVGDVNIDHLHLNDEQEQVETTIAPKKKKRKEPEAVVTATSIEEISQAYTGEMERTQATISNLRADRDELLKKIDFLEEEKLLSNRSTLTLRAELDEKKIELTIIRKKLNEEINELKDRARYFEEKILILEEKNKHLVQEIDKAGQKNKIDVKRVMLRERELEQKLELLKADAETQIRNRDLKILELKRRIDAMEFDMESMTQQEKKTLESRFELEDKLDKAIRTLRTAISNLEEEGNRNTTLDTLKKNVEM